MYLTVVSSTSHNNKTDIFSFWKDPPFSISSSVRWFLLIITQAWIAVMLLFYTILGSHRAQSQTSFPVWGSASLPRIPLCCHVWKQSAALMYNTSHARCSSAGAADNMAADVGMSVPGGVLCGSTECVCLCVCACVLCVFVCMYVCVCFGCFILSETKQNQ